MVATKQTQKCWVLYYIFVIKWYCWIIFYQSKLISNFHCQLTRNWPQWYMNDLHDHIRRLVDSNGQISMLMFQARNVTSKTNSFSSWILYEHAKFWWIVSMIFLLVFFKQRNGLMTLLLNLDWGVDVENLLIKFLVELNKILFQ